MRIMDLRQLEYFLRVAQRRNISAAAAELNITQPSLTKSMKLLEKELGVRLFDRLARGVELTDYGQTLLRHAEAVHVQIGDASSEIAALRSGTFGAVSVGAGPAWLRRHLPLAVAQTVARYPGIRIRVGGGFDEELFRALRRGDYDFVVAELPQAQDRRGLEVRPLTSDELGVCCRAGHPLAGRRRTAVRDLLAYPWVSAAALDPAPARRPVRRPGPGAAAERRRDQLARLPAQPAAAVRCPHLRRFQDRRDRGGVGTGDARRAQDQGAARSGDRQAPRRLAVAGSRARDRQSRRHLRRRSA